MKKDETKLQRSLRILWKLSREREVTVNDLHDYFEGQVSRRTIQRTLRDLSSADVPIRSTHGPHNEYRYSLDRPFDHIPETLTADETLAAVLLSQFSGVFEGTRIGEDIRTVFGKIEQLLPAGTVAVPTDFAGGRYVHYSQPGRTSLETYDEALQSIFRGILRTLVCRVSYRSKRYLFHPYSLLLHNGALYVVGKQPYYNDIIYLAVNRLRRVEVLDDPFLRDPDFSLRDFLADSFGIWYEEPVDVRIRFDAVVRPSIEHRNWHHSQRIEESGDGGIILHMHVGPSLELMAWILRWGAHVEVLAPASLREEIRGTAAAIQRNHASIRRDMPQAQRRTTRSGRGKKILDI